MTKFEEISNSDSLENDKEALDKVIQRLRESVKKKKILTVRYDDSFMLRYLRCSRYDPDIALQKMQTYYRLKFQNPDWYVTDETVSSFKSDLDCQLYYVLENRDRFGKRIYINKLGMIDTSKTTMMKQSQVQDLFLETILDEEDTQRNGLSVIVDLKNFSWTLLKWLTPTNVCIAVKKIESLPFKKIEFHVINTSLFVNAAIKLIWPFLSVKTKENIHFHDEDWTSLHEVIDPNFLPPSYGGVNTDDNIDRLLQIIPGGSEKIKENFRLGYSRCDD